MNFWFAEIQWIEITVAAFAMPFLFLCLNLHLLQTFHPSVFLTRLLSHYESSAASLTLAAHLSPNSTVTVNTAATASAA